MGRGGGSVPPRCDSGLVPGTGRHEAAGTLVGGGGVTAQTITAVPKRDDLGASRYRVLHFSRKRDVDATLGRRGPADRTCRTARGCSSGAGVV